MRIDKQLADKFGSRMKASTAISNGLVLVNGKKVSCSYELKDGDSIKILEAEESFVSAGGAKLSKAIKDFNYSAKDKVFADIGASTGGFTDCLLKNGAKKIYCVDVGENQLDKSLVCDKITIIDNFNARNLNKDIFSEELDGVVIDVSFISLTYIIGAVSNVLPFGGSVLALIKPQFECEKRDVGKNGIVKDPNLHKKAILKIINYAINCGLIPIKLTNAPIISGKNMEFIILLEKGACIIPDADTLLNSVKL